MKHPSWLGLTAAVIAIAVGGVYVGLLSGAGEGGGDTVYLPTLIAIAAATALAGSLATQPGHRLGLLATAALLLTGAGVQAIFIVVTGPPLVLAGLVAAAGCAATVGSRPPRPSG